MSINTDGQKKKGRFLKKGSRLLSSVSLIDFNFDEISTAQPLARDNPDRSIIHSRLHSPSEISTSVKEHKSINSTLEDPSKPRLGVIFPADFTQDWYNERLNSKKKKMDADDDEEEFDIAEAARTRVPQRSKISASLEPVVSGSELSPPHEIGNIANANMNQTVAHAVSPDMMRSSDNGNMSRPITEEHMSSAINKAFNSNHGQGTKKSSASATENQADEFTPLPTDSADHPIAAEEKAIEAWKTQQQIAKQNEQLLDELKSTARQEGYQSGFREGEEKGLISGQKKAAQVFSKVEEIIAEFEGLKSLVLENVQKNFYELSQAIGEALLGREFSIKPEAYATMIQRVIKDTIAPNEFKVRMHPETWQRVHDLGIADLTPHLVKDPSVAPGEFRVESSLTVVDVSAKKLVQQLLEKVDINLFDEKKAG